MSDEQEQVIKRLANSKKFVRAILLVLSSILLGIAVFNVLFSEALEPDWTWPLMLGVLACAVWLARLDERGKSESPSQGVASGYPGEHD